MRLNARTCKCNDGTYPFSLFSYGTVLTGNLDVYHILYTQPICAGMGSPVSSHIAGPPYLLGEHTLGRSLGRTPVRTSNRHGSAMQNIMIVVLSLDVRVRTLMMEEGNPLNAWAHIMHEVPNISTFIINEYNPLSSFMLNMSFLIFQSTYHT